MTPRDVAVAQARQRLSEITAELEEAVQNGQFTTRIVIDLKEAQRALKEAQELPNEVDCLICGDSFPLDSAGRRILHICEIITRSEHGPEVVQQFIQPFKAVAVCPQCGPAFEDRDRSVLDHG